MQVIVRFPMSWKNQPLVAPVERASPRKFTVRVAPDDWDGMVDDQVIEGMQCQCDESTIAFTGRIRKHVPPLVEIEIASLSVEDQLVLNAFLLGRLDRQYELSRKVEELALEEIQQLNRELTLSLKVEEAALTEAQQVNEELRSAQRDVMTSRNQLEAILNAITEGIYLIDRNFTLLALNRSQYERVQETSVMPLGTNCYRAFFRLDEPCQGCTAIKTFRTGQTDHRLFPVKRLNQQVLLEYYSFPVYDENNRVHQVVQYVQDVTRKREIEEHLFQTEKLAALGTMTAGIAHELRNPLSSISMTVQLLKQRYELLDPVIEKLEKIETQVNKAGKIVTDIRSFSRRERFELQPVLMSTCVEEILLQIRDMGLLEGIVLERTLSCPAVVLVEKDQLDQVLINLVQNAIDAMEGCTRKILRLNLSLCQDDEVCLVIEDTGRGIPDDNIDQIFNPFFTTKAPGKGTGLGLAITYKIIERHRGTIRVRSVEGEGSAFTIVLPVHHIEDID